MNTLFSISNKLAKSTKLDLERLRDEDGQNPGVQPVVTHSRQVAWQFQLFKIGESTVIIAIESYSRYVILLPFYFSPTWDELEAAFYERWFADIDSWMSMGRFVRSDQQRAQLRKQFTEQGEPQRHRNLDQSINGHIIDTQFWIRDYMDQKRTQEFDQQMAHELCAYINDQPKRVKDAKGKRCKFSPLERFLDDSLYRYAYGICDQPIPGCAMGDFPNPHRRVPNLRVV